ncbi:hypothetical protein ACWD04_21255 [Streptomyces sp. NPDC002911]
MANGLDALRAAVAGTQEFSWEPKRIAAQGGPVFTHSLVRGRGPARW